MYQNRVKWIHEFENLYILTYKSLYRHAKLIFRPGRKDEGASGSGLYGGVSARGTAAEGEESAGLAAEAF